MTLEAGTRLPLTENNNSTSIGLGKHSRQGQNDKIMSNSLEVHKFECIQ